MKSALSEFKGHKKILGVVLFEILAAMLVLVSFLNIFNFNILTVMETRAYEFALNLYVVDIGLFVLSVALLASIYFGIKRKSPLLYTAQQAAFSEIKEVSWIKLMNTKTDPRIAGLLVIELMFAVVVLLAVSAFFDPEFELIPWSAMGLQDPWTTIINLAIALIVILAFYWLYRQTADFRSGVQIPKKQPKPQKPEPLKNPKKSKKPKK